MIINSEQLKEGPIDVTNSLAPNLKRIRIYAVDPSYLINNAQMLAERQDPHLYALFGIYQYYSPANWSYDTSTEKTFLNFGDTTEPAMILVEDFHIPFYIPQMLVKQRPHLVYKAHDDLKNIAPMGIETIIFQLNIEEKTQKLVPLVLYDFKNIFRINGYRMYENYPEKQ